MDASSVSSRQVKWSCGGQAESRHGAPEDHSANVLYLMQLEAHSDSGGHHLLQQVQVSKDPLVFGGNAEVALEQGVETVQERFQTVRRNVGETIKTTVNEADWMVGLWCPLAVRLKHCKRDVITGYLLDMLWEAVPSDLLPRTESA